MTSPTGSKPISGPLASARLRTQLRRRVEPEAGFTLIELVLVMTMLVIVLSVAAPSLSRFFRGRSLDAEAKRFLALTRYGQSRAVAEGMPMLLWIDARQKTYGLQADSSYLDQDNKTLQYQLSPDVEIEVTRTVTTKKPSSFQPLYVWRGNGGISPTLPRIRFTPDGFISESSPDLVLFRQKDEGQIGVGEGLTRLNYEIKTNLNETFRR
jgi:type II secretion system protein H